MAPVGIAVAKRTSSGFSDGFWWYGSWIFYGSHSGYLFFGPRRGPIAKIYKLLQLVNKGSFEESFGTIFIELNTRYNSKHKSIASNLVVVELERVAGY